MTAQIILETFRDLGIEVKTANLPNNEALEALRTGAIDAMVSVVGKPGTFFRDIKDAKGIRFMPVELTKRLEENYVEGVLTPRGLPCPKWRTGKRSRRSPVSAVLAAYRPSSRTSRARMETFVDSLFSAIETLKFGPYHKKWSEVDLYNTVAGWQRVEAATSWLEENDPQ